MSELFKAKVTSDGRIRITRDGRWVAMVKPKQPRTGEIHEIIALLTTPKDKP